MDVLRKQSFTICELTHVLSCCRATRVVVKGKAVNLGDGDGMQVPCTLSFVGKVKFIEVLQRVVISAK